MVIETYYVIKNQKTKKFLTIWDTYSKNIFEAATFNLSCIKDKKFVESLQMKPGEKFVKITISEEK